MRLALIIICLAALLNPPVLQAEQTTTDRSPLSEAQVQSLFLDYGIDPDTEGVAGGDVDDAAPKPAEMVLGLKIYQALPQSTRDALGRYGTDHLDFAEDLITGYGDIDRINADRLRAYVGFQRAGLRGGVADQLVSADLDGDGILTAAEKVQAMQMLSSGLRSRLARTYDAADRDDDGTVSAREMAAYPDIYAQQRFGAADEQRIMALLAFDLNADGWVEVDELRHGLRALEDSGASDGDAIKLLIGG
ncbi:hypothetical protein FNJ84_15760 [Paracoccus sp. M683]|uniref:hypothetical protein n=1 Tax=Paracoccus sp. M683 TaxID=2594268 RepID=UPI00117E8CA7|nr:hypothetical protein [Paracoccus sp. M683]TRW95447.1 hypothetical protein FNJ84_15760 [Paracoccus sp. M683]